MSRILLHLMKFLRKLSFWVKGYCSFYTYSLCWIYTRPRNREIPVETRTVHWTRDTLNGVSSVTVPLTSTKVGTECRRWKEITSTLLIKVYKMTILTLLLSLRTVGMSLRFTPCLVTVNDLCRGLSFLIFFFRLLHPLHCIVYGEIYMVRWRVTR